jgi:hypothetical protein
LADVLKKESVELKVDHDIEEKEARIDAFDRFGVFNTLYALADGDFTKLDSAFNITYIEGFTILARKSEEARYSKRLRKVMK